MFGNNHPVVVRRRLRRFLPTYRPASGRNTLLPCCPPWAAVAAPRLATYQPHLAAARRHVSCRKQPSCFQKWRNDETVRNPLNRNPRAPCPRVPTNGTPRARQHPMSGVRPSPRRMRPLQQHVLPRFHSRRGAKVGCPWEWQASATSPARCCTPCGATVMPSRHGTLSRTLGTCLSMTALLRQPSRLRLGAWKSSP